MHNSTGYVRKQLVHAFSCTLSSYGARGKFGEHERSVRVARGYYLFFYMYMIVVTSEYAGFNVLGVSPFK